MTKTKKKWFTYIFLFFILILVAAGHVIFWPTPANDMQIFCEMAKISHIPSEVMRRTMNKAKTDLFFEFALSLSQMDSTLKYQATVHKAEDFGLKNWQCQALQKLWE